MDESPNPNPATQISSEIRRIADPLIAIGASPSRDVIGASLTQILADAGPRQAEVLRRCAVPRWFDEGVLAVLRESSEGNDRVLALLRAYSFVRPIDANRFSYHDEVRESLLTEWRTQRTAEYRQLNAQLAEYFRQRAAQTRPARSLPKGTTPAAITLAESGAWDLYQREALYHTLIADQTAGMAELEAAFTQAEASHQLGDVEVLLQLTRDVDLSQNARLAVRLMRARFEKASLKLAAAEAQFNALIATPGIDRVVAAQAQQSLGEIYAETGRWVAATECYQHARTSFEQANNQQAVGEVWRLLGEAYQALGTSTGGWHVPAYPQNRFWRGAGELWTWLLSLPFYLITPLMRSAGSLMPRPHFLASYRNWTLIWLYRTAATCYQRAHTVFERLGDDMGMLRTERQIADITRIFGYPDEALRQVEQMQQRPAAQDFYQRAWIDWVAAAALIDQRATTKAQYLLDGLLVRFRKVGDLRREVATMVLQARAEAREGQFDAALKTARECLDRYRNLRYAEARELVLYDLRALRRQVGPGERSQQIGVILSAEPEKRYVARFPRSQLPLLRVLSIVALPLALLLIAVFAPRESIAQVAQLASLQTTIDPVRGLLVVVILILIYSGVFALVATAVITFVPLGDLDREQPDYFVTNDQGISRYDFRGALAQQFRWGEIRRWLRVERNVWSRPVSLVSSAYLRNTASEVMQIDGITGWFLSLQEDIDNRLRAANSTVRSEDFGFTILRSWNGLLLACGAVLLIVFIWSQNAWAQWLAASLPAPVYAALSLLAFSGLLILIPVAYWLVISPLRLRRELGFRDYYPFVVAATGIAMMLIGGLQLVPRVPALNFSLIVCGALIAGAVLIGGLSLISRSLRLLLATLLIAGGLVYVGLGLGPVFDQLVSRVGADQAVLSAAAPAKQRSAASSLEAGQRVIDDPTTTIATKAQAYANQGRAFYAVGDYNAAFQAYSQALDLYAQLPEGETRTQAEAVALYNRYKAIRDSGSNGWRADLAAACQRVADVGPDCNP